MCTMVASTFERSDDRVGLVLFAFHSICVAGRVGGNSSQHCWRFQVCCRPTHQNRCRLSVVSVIASCRCWLYSMCCCSIQYTSSMLKQGSSRLQL